MQTLAYINSLGAVDMTKKISMYMQLLAKMTQLLFLCGKAELRMPVAQ